MKMPVLRFHPIGAIDWGVFVHEIGFIASGCLLWVFAMNAIMLPNDLLAGGVGGICLLLKYQIPSTDLGTAYLLLNLPLLLMGGIVFNRRFLFYTLFGISFFSWMASTIEMAPIVMSHRLWPATITAIVCGIGNGLILRSSGSAGGFDIVAIYLNRRFGVRVGSCSALFNAFIVAIGGFLFTYETVLLSVYFLFGSGWVTNLVVGFNFSKFRLPQAVPCPMIHH